MLINLGPCPPLPSLPQKSKTINMINMTNISPVLSTFWGKVLKTGGNVNHVNQYGELWGWWGVAKSLEND